MQMPSDQRTQSHTPFIDTRLYPVFEDPLAGSVQMRHDAKDPNDLILSMTRAERIAERSGKNRFYIRNKLVLVTR